MLERCVALMTPEAKPRLGAHFKGLRGLSPTALEFERLELLRTCDLEALGTSEVAQRLICELGLNDEYLHEFPEALHRYAGQGLRVWQFPNQFGPYLAQLARLQLRSYLEIGVRHGGSFVTTVEYLKRFGPVTRSVAVDVIPCPSLEAHCRQQQGLEFACLNTQGAAYTHFLSQLGSVDLAFVDSHHEEAQCRGEFLLLREHAENLSFHDIVNVNCPGVGKVWQEVKASGEYHCLEYVAQYDERGPYMGIGLAVGTRWASRLAPDWSLS